MNRLCWLFSINPCVQSHNNWSISETQICSDTAVAFNAPTVRPVFELAASSFSTKPDHYPADRAVSVAARGLVLLSWYPSQEQQRTGEAEAWRSVFGNQSNASLLQTQTGKWASGMQAARINCCLDEGQTAVMAADDELLFRGIVQKSVLVVQLSRLREEVLCTSSKQMTKCSTRTELEVKQV